MNRCLLMKTTTRLFLRARKSITLNHYWTHNRAALHEVPLYVDAMSDLSKRCVLFGQRVQEASRVKTHSRATRPVARKQIQHATETDAKAMKAIFRNTCQFCGAHTKDPASHALRCAPFFQANAAKYLTRSKLERIDLEGLKAERPRQHERERQYKTWPIHTTPLGKALVYNTGADAKPMRQAVSVGQGEHVVVSEGQNLVFTGAANTGLRRYFKPAVLGEPNTPANKAGENRKVPWICRVLLQNPHSPCYVNAGILALMHVVDVGGLAAHRIQFLKHAMVQSAQSGTPLRLSSLLLFRSILPNWVYSQGQRDAAEYMMHFLQATNLLQLLWVQNTAQDNGAIQEQGRSTYTP